MGCLTAIVGIVVGCSLIALFFTPGIKTLLCIVAVIAVFAGAWFVSQMD